jgi:hypothetical protein
MTLSCAGASGHDDPLAAGLELLADDAMATCADRVIARVRELYPGVRADDPRFEAAVVNVLAGIITSELGQALAPPPRTGPLTVVPGLAPNPRLAAA